MAELTVILGAEVTMLIVIAIMTLRAKRMDVLSGRFFERGSTGKLRPIWIRTWAGAQEFHRSILRRWKVAAKGLRLGLYL
ncbi:hypothetical protein AAE026_17525 [Bradyrhizobium sp. DN5]|uniref:hypothetical protein n=1 Tax=Bradyrhizobium sp. DN5 TaxID=3056950 RepID=UPI0035269B4A